MILLLTGQRGGYKRFHSFCYLMITKIYFLADTTDREYPRVCGGNVWHRISSQSNFSKYTPPDNYNEDDNKIHIIMALTDINGLVRAAKQGLFLSSYYLRLIIINSSMY